MKVRSYPGRAVLEDPELLLDPDATRGRAMELLYEASWRECGVNWTNGNGGGVSKIVSRQQDDESYTRRPCVADMVSQLEAELEDRHPDESKESLTKKEIARSSRGSSSTDTTDSDCSELNQSSSNNAQGGFLIPRPRLIVPVHTYARRRRTGAPQPVKRRQMREGTGSDAIVVFFFSYRNDWGYFLTNSRGYGLDKKLEPFETEIVLKLFDYLWFFR